MLEDGEIDEEDLEISEEETFQANQPTRFSPNSQNSSTTLKPIKPLLSLSPNPSITNSRSSLSPNSDIGQAYKRKIKSESTSSKQIKRNRKAASKNLNDDFQNENDDDNDDGELSPSDYSSNHINHADFNNDSNLDKDERGANDMSNQNDLFQQITQSTQSVNVASSWSTPLSKNEIKKNNNNTNNFNNKKPQTGPISLFDLVINPTSMTNKHDELISNSYVDPIITEKENNQKPLLKIFSNKPSNKNEPDESEMTVSIESLEKKMQKKRMYSEIQKDRAKKEAEKQLQKQQQQQQQREQILCHFFLEGRCQKGDKCTFSHNTQSNKKYEICKYYLNGFCAKNEKCLYMHSEFPCKFFHRINFQTGQKKNACAYNETCRFSHEPITNPLIKEAFEKYLSENNNESNQPSAAIASSIPSLLPQLNQIKKPSLLGSPPPALIASDDSAIPSLMDLPIKKEKSSSPPPIFQTKTLIPSLLGTNVSNSTIRNNSINKLNMLNTNKASQYKDVDERCDIKPEPKVLLSTPLINDDVDERHVVPKIKTESKSSTDHYETVKKELIIKIMKAVADEDDGVFSQIPKSTLTELLVKLINATSENQNQLSIEVIVALLATVTNAQTTKQPKDDDMRSHLNNTYTNLNDSNSLQIDLDSRPASATKNGRHNGSLSHHSQDDDYDDYYDDENDDENLVIEGNIGEFPYKLVEILIEPSKLWTYPPVDNNDSLSNSNNGDQECDPRIKYYSNKSNLSNVANFQSEMHAQNLLQQEKLEKQQLTPTSPNSQQTVTKPPNRSADPRLASRANTNTSPTRPASPNKQQDLVNSVILPLLNGTQSNASSSLLSSLPDFQAPLKLPHVANNEPVNQRTNNMQQHDTNTVKLSIEDYKRKLQKPSLTPSTTTTSNLTHQTASTNQKPVELANPSSLPSIPSYAVNLQAPQSLHELLRNFMS